MVGRQVEAALHGSIDRVLRRVLGYANAGADGVLSRTATRLTQPATSRAFASRIA
jgi:2-methylisocitrate lyase-like PEP mutase family enzyme